MRDAVLSRFGACRVLVSAAAVSDFRPARAAAQKVKKAGAPRALRLLPNPDILKLASARKGSRLLVGFAAETQDLLAHAQAKLKAKRLDLMVANLVGRAGTGFGAEENEAVLLAPHAAPRPLPRMPKAELAGLIVEAVAALLLAKRAPGRR
jgi:phosphopantothenoylcysteine decarboxylase/phosphopantothenate--cysteine ligase